MLKPESENLNMGNLPACQPVLIMVRELRRVGVRHCTSKRFAPEPAARKAHPPPRHLNQPKLDNNCNDSFVPAPSQNSEWGVAVTNTVECGNTEQR